MIPSQLVLPAKHHCSHSRPKESHLSRSKTIVPRPKATQLLIMEKLPSFVEGDKRRGQFDRSKRPDNAQYNSTCYGCQRCELERLLEGMKHSPTCESSTNLETKQTQALTPTPTPTPPKSHIHIQGVCKCGNVLLHNVGKCRCQKPYYRRLTLVPITYESTEVASKCWACLSKVGESAGLVRVQVADEEYVGCPE